MMIKQTLLIALCCISYFSPLKADTAHPAIVTTASYYGSSDFDGGLAIDSQGIIFYSDGTIIRRRDPMGSTSVNIVEGISPINGLSISSTGAFVFSSRGQIYRMSSAGSTQVLAGGLNEHSHIDGPVAAARFGNSTTQAVDVAGNIYVADKFHHVIRKISTEGYVTTIAGSAGTYGSTDGVGSAALFNYPNAIMMDADGSMIVLDNAHIRRVTPSGTVTTLADLPGLASGVVRHADGNYYVAIAGAVLRVTPSGAMATVAGSLTDFNGSRVDGIGENARFNRAQAIATAPDGALIVGDGSTFRRVAINDVPIAPVIATQPTSVTALVGGDATFTAVSYATQPASYQWHKNGNAIFGQTSPEMDFVDLTLDDSGNYTLTITNALGSVTTAAAILNVVTVATNDSFSARPSLNTAPVSVSAEWIGTTREAGEPVHAAGNDGGSLWWNWTAPSDGFVTFDASASTAPSVLGVYSGTTVDALSPAAPAMAYDGTNTDLRKTIEVIAGNTYQIAVERVASATPGVAHLSINYAYIVTVLAGTPGQSAIVDGTGAAANFNAPEGIAIDPNGNLYVADMTTIRKVTPAGVVSTFVTGAFNRPSGLVFDASNNLYMTDTSNHVIRKITPGGGVSILAGSNGASNYQDGTGSGAQFHFPDGIAIDQVGNLYVCDKFNHVIRKITPSGVTSTLAGGARVSGYVDGVGSEARFNYPSQISLHGNTLYVSDNAGIRKVDITTGSVSTFNSSPELSSLWALDFASDGHLYAASPTAIWRVAPTGAMSLLMGGNRLINNNYVEGDGPLAVFSYVKALATDSSGNIWFSSGNAICRAAPSSLATAPLIYSHPESMTVALGTNTHIEVTAFGGPRVNYQWQKDGVPIVGQTGKLLHFSAATLSDSGSYTVTVSNPSGAVTSDAAIFTVVPVPSNDDFSSAIILTGLSSSGTGSNYGASLEAGEPILTGTPSGRTVWWSWTAPADGTVVADGGGSEIKTALGVYSGDTLGSLELIGSNGNIDQVDVAKVQFVVTAGVTYHFSLDGVVGAPAEDGNLRLNINYVYSVVTLAGGYGYRDGPIGQALFGSPRAITRDSSGNLYVADQSTDVIRKVTPSGEVSTLAGSPNVSGTTDGTGNGALFDNVYGLTTDPSGNIYAVEYGAHIVRKITPAGVVTTLAGAANQAGSTDGTGSAARFNRPSAIVLAADGFLYVSDRYSGFYRKIDPSSRVVTSVAISSVSAGLFATKDAAGNYYYYNNTSQTLQKEFPDGQVIELAGAYDVNRPNVDGVGNNARFKAITSMVADSDGTIYFCDNQSHIIRRATPTHLAQAPMITSITSGRAVARGSDLELTVAIIASPHPTYVWKYNGAVITGESSPTLRLTDLQVAQSGEYTVEVTNTEGTVIGGPIHLEVLDTPLNDHFTNRISISTLPTSIEGHNFLTTVESGEPLHHEAGGGHSVWWSWTAPTDGLVMLNTQFSSIDTLVAVYTGADLNNLIEVSSGGKNASGLAARLTFAVTAGIQYHIALDGRAGAVGKLAFELFYASQLEEVNPTMGGQGIIAAPDGNFYFADGLNHVIRKMTSAGVVTEVAGQVGISGSVDGVGTAAQFNSPIRLVRASDGTIYVTDSSHTIRRIAPDGGVTTIAGQPGVTGSADGVGGAASFSYPAGIALNADETKLVIIDRNNRTLRLLELSTGDVTTLVGTAGVRGFADGIGSVVRFIGINDIQLSHDGNFYVPDGGSEWRSTPYGGYSVYHSRIRKVSLDGSVWTVAGRSNWGNVDGVGGTAAFGNSLKGICLDNQGNLLVSDTGLIRRVTPEGVVTTISQAGPWFDDLAIAPDGTGYAVSYNKTYKLGIFDHTYIPPAPVITSHPLSIDRFTGQNVYFSVTASGDQSSFTYQWSHEGTPISGATSQELTLTGVTLADVGDYTVVVTNGGGSTTSNAASVTINTRPANDDFSAAVSIIGSEPYAAGNNFGAGKEVDEPSHGGKLGGASLWWTWTATSSGSVIADTSGTEFDALVGVYTGSDVANLTEVASASQELPANNSYTPLRTSVMFTAIAGTTYRIAVDAEAGFAGNVELRIFYTYHLSTVAGKDGASGYADGFGDNALFNSPRGIVADSGGNLYVADSWNHIIRKITPSGDVTTIAGLSGSSGSTDGAGSAARFYYPNGIVIDANGDLFVADSGNHVIRKITASGEVSTFAGVAGAAGSVNGVGTAARFSVPSHLAIDGSGNLFVTDNGKCWVRKITPAAMVSTLAGQADTAGAVDDTGTAALFSSYLAGLACDASGNVVVTDHNNRLIRKITSAGVVTSIAGVVEDRAFVDGSAANARLELPGAITVRPDGSILFLDGNAIRMLRVDGSVVTVVGLNISTATAANGTGRDVRFRGINGIWVDSNDVLYTSEGTAALIRRGILSSSPSAPSFSVQPISHRVITGTDLVLTAEALSNPSPTYQWQKNGIDIPGSTAATLMLNNAQVSDSGNYTLVASNAIGSRSSVVAMVEVLPLPSNDAFVNRSSLSGDRVEITGYNYLASTEANEPSHAGGVASHSVWYTWTAPGSGNVTIDTLGSSIGTGLAVYRGNSVDGLSLVVENATTSEQDFSRVRFNVNAGDVFQIAVDGVAGATGDFRLTIEYSWTFGLHSGGFADRGTADGELTNARYSFPTAVAADSQGNLFVADRRNHTIRKITPTGSVTTFAGSPEVAGFANGTGTDALFNYPYGLAMDHLDNLYVADMGNHSIRKITSAGVVSLLAGSGSAEMFGSDDGTGAAARFKTPIGVAVDATGHVYVTDYHNRLIRKITPAGAVTTLAGTLNATGGGGQYFNVPWGIAVDSTGNIYVSDNADIRKITAEGVTSVFAGHANGATGDADGVGADARFNRPCHMVFDAEDNLFVADGNNHLLRKISPDGTVRTLGGLSGNRTYSNGIANDATFADPMGITMTQDGMLYIADSLNQLIRSGRQLIAREQTITFDTPADVTDVASPITLVASSSSGLPVSFQIISGPATILGNTLSINGAGTVTVRAVQAGNASFLPASPIERSFAVSGFDAWLRGKFTTADLADTEISGKNSDPDGDGLKNLMEYALGLEPKAHNSNGYPVLNASATHWVYIYTRPASRPDLTFEIQMATNMSSWSANGIVHELVSTNDGVETWKGSIPLGAVSHAFFRLKVTQP